jgi:putative FmdB family regulatory protein
MPIYDYHCATCNRRVSLFFRSFRAAAEGAAQARCPICGGSTLERIISTPTLLRRGGARTAGVDAADAADPRALDAEDPRTLAGLLRATGQALDEPLEGEMGEIVGRLEAGESAAEVGAALDDPTEA